MGEFEIYDTALYNELLEALDTFKTIFINTNGYYFANDDLVYWLGDSVMLFGGEFFIYPNDGDEVYIPRNLTPYITE